MGITYTWYAPFPAPTLSAQLQDGGSLTANTTYYVRVTAVNGPNVEGAPSNEISVTTTSTQRSILLSWNAVTNEQGLNPSGYAIYVRTTQPNYCYYGAFWYGPQGSLSGHYSVPHPNTSYVVTGTETQYRPSLLWCYAHSLPLPFQTNLGRGWLKVISDTAGGTPDINAMHAAVSAGFSTLIGNVWILQGHLSFQGSGPITWSLNWYDIHLAGRLNLDSIPSGSSLTFTDCTIWEYSDHYPRPFDKRVTFRRVKRLWPGVQYGYPINPYWARLNSSNSVTLDKADFSSASVTLTVDAACTIRNVQLSDRDYQDIAATYDEPSMRNVLVQLPRIQHSTAPIYGVVVGSDLRYANPAGSVALLRSFSRADGADNLPNTVSSANGAVSYQYKLKLTVQAPSTDDSLVPVPGASVVVRDSSGTVVYTGTTDSNGQIGATTPIWLTVATFSGYPAVRTDNTPHTIEVTKEGYFTERVSIRMIGDKDVTVMLKQIEYVEVPIFTPVASIDCIVSSQDELMCEVLSESEIICEVSDE